MGASSGIGRELARRLMAEGWQVGVAARRMERLDQIRVEGYDAPHRACIDINSDGADERLRLLIEEMGGVDLYVHVSGVGWQNMELEAERELQTVSTNALGFTRMVGEAYRWMAEHGGGQIAVVSSIAGTQGLGPAPAYSATKRFQSTYIQALEQQAYSRGLRIRFTELRPGFVDTDLIQGASFPMTMRVDDVAEEMLWAIGSRQHLRIIDWRWRIVTALWRSIPRWMWRHLRLARG